MIYYRIASPIGDLMFSVSIACNMHLKRRDILVSHAELYIDFTSRVERDNPRNDNIAADLYFVRLYLSLLIVHDSLDSCRRSVDEAVSQGVIRSDPPRRIDLQTLVQQICK